MRRRMLKRIRKAAAFLAGEQGLSLIEIVVIIVILGVSIIPISRLVRTNLHTMAVTAVYSQAEYYAQSVMEEVVADYTAENSGRGYSWVVSNWSGGTETHPELGWSADVAVSATTVDNIDYAVVTVTVNPGSDFEDVQLTSWLVDCDVIF